MKIFFSRGLCSMEVGGKEQGFFVNIFEEEVHSPMKSYPV